MFIIDRKMPLFHSILLLHVIFTVRALVFATTQATSSNNSTDYLENCPPFRNVPNANIELSNYLGEFTVKIICDPDYHLVGKGIFYCKGRDWNYEAKPPKCVKRCSAPPYLEHGEIQLQKLTEDVFTPTSKYLEGTIAKYSCLEGYSLKPISASVRICESGTWSGSDAFCKPTMKTFCAYPPSVENGFFKSAEPIAYPIVRVGHEIEYRCDTGFKLVGSPTAECTDEGIWEPPAPKCVKSDYQSNIACSSIPLLDPKVNQQIEITAVTEYKSEVVVRCKKPYVDTITPCQNSIISCRNGKWTGVYPQCVMNNRNCHPPPSVQYMAIVDHNFETSYDSDGLPYFPIDTRIQYDCIKGYSLKGSGVIVCQSNGCWEEVDQWPTCVKSKATDGYVVELYDLNAILLSSATGAGVLGILLLACLVVICKKRKFLARTIAVSTPSNNSNSRPDVVNDHSVLLQHPDRLALIAFAEGVQNSSHHSSQSFLPSYDEATRDRSTLNNHVNRPQFQRPPFPNVAAYRGNGRNRNSSNADYVSRHGSFVSHTSSMRSGEHSLGSTDTMTISDGSFNITLDTASSHSAISQNPSCRVHCGSLASFDGCSILNTEEFSSIGFPLLEENEGEDFPDGTVNGNENPAIPPDNVSSKISTHSAPIITN